MLDKINAYTLLFYGTINFVVLTALGMLFYPGGKFHDHYSKGYSFFENFFSDLGRYKTFTREPKYISLFLFLIAIFTLSVVVINFVFKFLKDVTPSGYPTVKTVAKIFTILFALLLCGVALTPYDKFFLWHAFTSKACFLMMLPMCLSLSFLVYKDQILSNKYAIFMLSVSIVLLIYIYILFFGPTVGSNKFFQPVAQKIIVYLLIFSLMYLAQGCRRYLKK